MGTIKGLVLGAIVGLIVGAGGMLLAFPYVFPPAEVNERIDASSIKVLISESSFREGVDGQDSAHWGRGDVKVYEADDGQIMIAFQENFEVGPGPDFWIYLTTEKQINNEEQFFADTKRHKLTQIKSFKGAQVYTISASDYEKAASITIWCETFSQYIASADF